VSGIDVATLTLDSVMELIGMHPTVELELFVKEPEVKVKRKRYKQGTTVTTNLQQKENRIQS
jgi:hypothetical protein